MPKGKAEEGDGQLVQILPREYETDSPVIEFVALVVPPLLVEKSKNTFFQKFNISEKFSHLKRFRKLPFDSSKIELILWPFKVFQMTSLSFEPTNQSLMLLG